MDAGQQRWRSVRTVGLLVVAGCGRIDFDVRAAAPPADAIAATDAADAAEQIIPVCGDGVCDTAHGEICGVCPEDCAKPNLCGNGDCDPGETSATCETDCGPSPWPWDDSQMITALNAARAAGYMCPGTSSVTTAPALALDSTGTAVVNQIAWQLAHEHFYITTSDTTCGGETFSQIISNFDATVFTEGGFTTVYATAGDAIAGMLLDTGLCPIVMDANAHFAAAGVAFDYANGYMILLHQ